MTDAPRLGNVPDVRAGRLPDQQYAANFDDVVPPLDPGSALVEANRCYFCYDAPCIEACPTGIDIPSFIRKIATGNLAGSALRILEANILGGSCARVCPTEVLCERACVRTAQEGKPVAIGRLQRHATDNGIAAGPHPFGRAAPSGRRVAIVGGGPAGLACAHRLAMHGHQVIIYEARERLGGLNEYGVAEYKVPHRFARREVEFILGIGGIEVKTGQRLGRDISLERLRRDHDAVFLGLGLAGVRSLGCEGETLDGVRNAVDFIEDIRQAEDFARIPVGRQVVVIGGGNTAIDAAVQARRLGAEIVTIVYRRGPEAMSATGHEQDFARTSGITIRHNAIPRRLLGDAAGVRAVQFGRTAGGDEVFELAADMVLKAIGQVFVADPVRDDARQLLELADGRIRVDEAGRTSLDGVWAGGDCVAGGQDLTVQATQHGKIAAEAIHRALGS